MPFYRLLLFDLDGTLTDPKEGITRSVRYALSKFGLEAKLDDLVSFIGPPLLESFRQLYSFDEAKARLAVEYYREYFAAKGIFQNTVYPGIASLLRRLKEEGYELAVATSKPTVFAEKILQHFRLAEYFFLVVGSNLDGTGTDKSEIISHVLQHKPSCSRDEAVMIGDRKHDIIGARRCGIDSIAVAYGYGSREELEEALPTYLVQSVAELSRLLLK